MATEKKPSSKDVAQMRVNSLVESHRDRLSTKADKDLLIALEVGKKLDSSNLHSLESKDKAVFDEVLPKGITSLEAIVKSNGGLNAAISDVLYGKNYPSLTDNQRYFVVTVEYILRQKASTNKASQGDKLKLDFQGGVYELTRVNDKDTKGELKVEELEKLEAGYRLKREELVAAIMETPGVVYEAMSTLHEDPSKAGRRAFIEKHKAHFVPTFNEIIGSSSPLKLDEGKAYFGYNGTKAQNIAYVKTLVKMLQDGHLNYPGTGPVPPVAPPTAPEPIPDPVPAEDPPPAPPAPAEEVETKEKTPGEVLASKIDHPGFQKSILHRTNEGFPKGVQVVSQKYQLSGEPVFNAESKMWTVKIQYSTVLNKDGDVKKIRGTETLIVPGPKDAISAQGVQEKLSTQLTLKVVGLFPVEVAPVPDPTPKPPTEVPPSVPPVPPAVPDPGTTLPPAPEPPADPPSDTTPTPAPPVPGAGETEELPADEDAAADLESSDGLDKMNKKELLQSKAFQELVDIYMDTSAAAQGAIHKETRIELNGLYVHLHTNVERQKKGASTEVIFPRSYFSKEAIQNAIDTTNLDSLISGGNARYKVNGELDRSIRTYNDALIKALEITPRYYIPSSEDLHAGFMEAFAEKAAMKDFIQEHMSFKIDVNSTINSNNRTRSFTLKVLVDGKNIDSISNPSVPETGANGSDIPLQSVIESNFMAIEELVRKEMAKHALEAKEVAPDPDPGPAEVKETGPSSEVIKAAIESFLAKTGSISHNSRSAIQVESGYTIQDSKLKQNNLLQYDPDTNEWDVSLTYKMDLRGEDHPFKTDEFEIKLKFEAGSNFDAGVLKIDLTEKAVSDKLTAALKAQLKPVKAAPEAPDTGKSLTEVTEEMDLKRKEDKKLESWHPDQYFEKPRAFKQADNQKVLAKLEADFALIDDAELFFHNDSPGKAIMLVKGELIKLERSGSTDADHADYYFERLGDNRLYGPQQIKGFVEFYLDAGSADTAERVERVRKKFTPERSNKELDKIRIMMNEGQDAFARFKEIEARLDTSSYPRKQLSEIYLMAHEVGKTKDLDKDTLYSYIKKSVETHPTEENLNILFDEYLDAHKEEIDALAKQVIESLMAENPNAMHESSGSFPFEALNALVTHQEQLTGLEGFAEEYSLAKEIHKKHKAFRKEMSKMKIKFRDGTLTAEERGHLSKDYAVLRGYAAENKLDTIRFLNPEDVSAFNKLVAPNGAYVKQLQEWSAPKAAPTAPATEPAEAVPAPKPAAPEAAEKVDGQAKLDAYLANPSIDTYIVLLSAATDNPELSVKIPDLLPDVLKRIESNDLSPLSVRKDLKEYQDFINLMSGKGYKTLESRFNWDTPDVLQESSIQAAKQLKELNLSANIATLKTLKLSKSLDYSSTLQREQARLAPYKEQLMTNPLLSPKDKETLQQFFTGTGEFEDK